MGSVIDKVQKQIVASGRIFNNGITRTASVHGCTVAYLGIGNVEITLAQPVAPDQLHFSATIDKSDAGDVDGHINLTSSGSAGGLVFLIETYADSGIHQDNGFFFEFAKVSPIYPLAIL